MQPTTRVVHNWNHTKINVLPECRNFVVYYFCNKQTIMKIFATNIKLVFS